MKRVLAGEILDSEIDRAISDEIDKWHEDTSGDPIELHDALGMTFDEYSFWAEDPEALPIILYARRFHIPLRTLPPSKSMPELAIAARGTQRLTREQQEALLAWLRRHNLG